MGKKNRSKSSPAPTASPPPPGLPAVGESFELSENESALALTLREKHRAARAKLASAALALLRAQSEMNALYASVIEVETGMQQLSANALADRSFNKPDSGQWKFDLDLMVMTRIA